MVKYYLRYTPAATFGVVTSSECNIAYDNSGKLLLTGALEQLLVWNVKQGSCVKKLCPASSSGPSSAVTFISAMPTTNSTVAGGYGDGSIRIWDIAKGVCETVLNGHKAATTALRFNKSASLLASGSKDTDIIIWDVVGETGLFRLRGHRDQVTDLVFLEVSKKLVSSSKDKFVRVWDIDTQHCIQTVPGHHSEIWSMDVDPNERFLVTGSADEAIKIFNISADKSEEQPNGLLEKITPENTDSAIPNQNKWGVLTYAGDIKRQSKERVATIKFSANGSILACQVAGKAVEFYRVLDEKEALKKVKRKLSRKRQKVLKKGTNETEPEEKIDALESSSMITPEIFKFLHILRAKQKIRSISFCPLLPKKEFSYLLALSLHNNSVEMYEVGQESYSKIHAIDLPGHGSDIRSLALSSDDSLLLSTSHNLVKIWNPSTGCCLRTMEAGYGLCSLFAPGNKYAFVGTKTGALEFFDIGASDRINALEAHSGSIWSIVPTLDGSGFITGSADHNVKFWEYRLLDENENASQKLSVENTRTLQLKDDVLCVRLSPNGRHIAVALLDSTIKVFFVDTLKFFLSLYGHKLPVLCMDISSDGNLLVSGSADKNLKIWGLDFGDCHRSLFAHSDSVMAVQFVRNTHYMFSVGKDRLLKYWDADKFELLLTLEGHHAELWCVAISSYGDFVVTGSHDRSIRRWDRTEEIFNLEDAREERLEAIIDSGQDDTMDNRFGLKEDIPEEGAVALPGKKTQETMNATDSIIEALDIAEVEVERLKKHEEDVVNGSKARFQPNIIMLGYSPSEFVLRSVSSVRTNDLEQALLALPFTDALKLFSYVLEWIQQSDKVELVCRICILLLQIHHHQLVGTPAARSVLTAIQDNLRKRVKYCKDTLGFNLAAMEHIKQLLIARSDAPFKNASAKLREIRALLAKRRNDDPGSEKKIKHKKHKKFHRIQENS